jgi:hypothetical protein
MPRIAICTLLLITSTGFAGLRGTGLCLKITLGFLTALRRWQCCVYLSMHGAARLCQFSVGAVQVISLWALCMPELLLNCWVNLPSSKDQVLRLAQVFCLTLIFASDMRSIYI